MPEYAWMCLYKQDSEYDSGPKYTKTMNMTNYWKWQGSQYGSVQRPKYARIWLDRVLNISWLLNMPGFWSVTQGSKYATVWFDMS